MSRFTLRRFGVGISLVLATALGASTFAPSDAYAQDERRRKISLRDVDEMGAQSEQYAKMAQQKRLESIGFLKELLSQNPDAGEQRAEMMLRLADLYFEEGRFLFLQEMAAFDKEFEKCFDTEGCDSEKLQPDNSGSKDWQSKSIRLYQQILRSYPRYQRADEATFFMGSALWDTNQKDEAMQAFTKLVKQYPDSAFVPDAYVNIGEYYFDNNNAYKALLAYKKAAAFREHSKYAYSMYKLGWCYYNVGEYGKGIDTMKAVVAYSMNDSSGKASNLQLQEEALKDLVRFFADAGEMDEAYEYFNKLGKKELIRSMLKRLANMYFEQGKFEQCIQTYRRLIAENPQSPEAPEYQNEIIQAYKKIGKKQETLAEIDRQLKTYGKNSAWARANASDQDAIKDAEKAIEKNLRAVAFDYHNEAKKLKTGRRAEETYELAYQAYIVYLEEFPESTHAYEVHYAVGELTYTLKKYDEAFEHYMAVVKMDPKGKRSKFCAESAIFAADEMVKKAGSDKEKATDKKADAIPLTDWENRLVEACNQYATLYPEDKKVIGIIYKSAYLLYNKNQFDKASDQFKAVIKMDPSSKQAEQGANLILDSFVITEDWNKLKENAKFYFDQEGLGGKSFKQDVYNVYQRASFKVIEVDFDKNKNYGKSAKDLESWYEEFQGNAEMELLAQALNNSAVYYNEANKIVDAMRIRHILVEDERFGDKTKYYKDQIAALGYGYEMVADFEQAAHYYEKLFEVDKEHENAKDAIYSAAVFRNAQGNWEQAIENYQEFIATYGDDERVNDTKLTIAKIYEDHDKLDEAAKVYQAFYSKAGEDTPMDFVYFARLHYGQAMEKLGKTSARDKVYEETVSMYKKYIEGGGEVGAPTEYVAEMMFTLAEPQFEKYIAKKIDTSGARGSGRAAKDKALTKNLGEKGKLLLETEKVYLEIIKTGAGEWGLASLVKLGQAYENMGDSLRNSYIPDYLTEDQREIYTMALEDKVYPQIEKAKEAYAQALNKSYELSLYNDNTAFATRRLGELRPEDFPGLEEELLDPRYISSQSRSFDFEEL